MNENVQQKNGDGEMSVQGVCLGTKALWGVMNIVGIVCVHGRSKACGVQEFKKKTYKTYCRFQDKTCEAQAQWVGLRNINEQSYVNEKWDNLKTWKRQIEKKNPMLKSFMLV